ncbi:MAG: hypothetical protein LC099_00450 [Anaerolineales bacterium]|nr:hypothetical protein [Anaerolineales bacterium]
MTDGKKVSATHGSVSVGGNVSGSNIIVGDKNVVNSNNAQTTNQLTILFEKVQAAVDKSENIPAADKADVKAELQDIQKAFEEPQPDETFIERRLRSIKRMAPEIVEIAFETLKNPVGGVAEVVKRIAAKMAENAA